ncbi:MAG: hypothetical protein IPK16_17710 [Anaerolineales bacterium]|nr:hypothetical protein [Anaerolineales bacterium]
MSENDLAVWNLVSDISQGLQMSFASIKAAISSLLDPDIIWDQQAQHEFMQTIDDSVDGLSDLTAVMTVAMRVESQSLAIHREPNSLQEILSQAQDQVQQRTPATTIVLTLPAEARMGYLDFAYFRMALCLLMEVLIGAGDRVMAVLSIQLLENSTGWKITFEGDFSGVRDLIGWFCYDAPDCALLPATVRPETRLKALTAYQLLRLHAIEMVTNGEGGDRKALTLHIPFEAEA